MKPLRSLLFVGLACLTAPSPASPTRAGDLTPMNIQGSFAKASGVTVDLGEADDPKHPTAWQGPLKIMSAKSRTCTTADISIITPPLWLGHSALYVSTYSGSQNQIIRVDVKSCQVIWKSQPFSGSVHYLGGRQWRVGSHRVSLPTRHGVVNP